MDESSLPVEPEEETTLPAGARLGKYLIVRLLGAGGMGAVYEAVHTEIGKRVAVKTLAPAVAAVPGARQRFLREAQLTSRLHHPHIVDLTDMGTEGRVAYLVMELLAGEDLAHRLERTGALAVVDLVDLMLPVCSALVAAHDAGIVHRDLKPQNIFLASGHHGVHSKVLDFGISKSSETDLSSSLTNTGSVIGTPHYLAPEQIKDARTASPASDQYAIGVIFYKCLANVNPFEGNSIFSVMQAIVTETPVPLRERRADLPEGFDRIVERAMNPLPWERFGSVRELGRALLPFASPKARVIWEEAFTNPPKTPSGETAKAVVAATSIATPTPGIRHDTEPMPLPEPRKARAADAAATTQKARLDGGTLEPSVTDVTRRGPLHRGTIFVGVLVAAIAVVAVVLMSTRGARAPEVRAPAAATPPAAAAPTASPAAPAPAAAPSSPPVVAHGSEATAPVEPEQPADEKAKQAPPSLSKRRSSSPSRTRGPRARPEAPAAPTRGLNPNGAPVID